MKVELVVTPGVVPTGKTVDVNGVVFEAELPNSTPATPCRVNRPQYSSPSAPAWVTFRPPYRSQNVLPT